jgi:hypothetical protein
VISQTGILVVSTAIVAVYLGASIGAFVIGPLQRLGGRLRRR